MLSWLMWRRPSYLGIFGNVHKEKLYDFFVLKSERVEEVRYAFQNYNYGSFGKREAHDIAELMDELSILHVKIIDFLDTYDSTRLFEWSFDFHDTYNVANQSGWKKWLGWYAVITLGITNIIYWTIGLLFNNRLACFLLANPDGTYFTRAVKQLNGELDRFGLKMTYIMVDLTNKMKEKAKTSKGNDLMMLQAHVNNLINAQKVWCDCIYDSGLVPKPTRPEPALQTRGNR